MSEPEMTPERIQYNKDALRVLSSPEFLERVRRHIRQEISSSHTPTGNPVLVPLSQPTQEDNNESARRDS